MAIQVDTLENSPNYMGALRALSRGSWPEFLIHGEMPSWDRIYDELAGYVLLLINDGGDLAGAGFTIPACWDGTVEDLPGTIETIIAAGLDLGDTPPDTLIAVAALVDSRYRGKHLSSEILKQMNGLAQTHSCRDLIVPVRPTWKARYPLQSIEQYASWRREDGFLFDPWLRTHERLGATVLACVDTTLTVQGTVEEWQEWTGMVFPKSGSYIVEGALQPVVMDVENDIGIYDDPNVWMRHKVI